MVILLLLLLLFQVTRARSLPAVFSGAVHAGGGNASRAFLSFYMYLGAATSLGRYQRGKSRQSYDRLRCGCAFDDGSEGYSSCS